ncbi:hypothetical protein ACQEXU_06260 [Vibrio sp. TRT 21S02]|uniref:hypothetical protein n=1 Tax=Vibrio sp. TRT 21S02 TaxID=3418507 RepID=UPI003CF3FD87
MNSLQAYEEYNSRTAINMAGNTQGWEINGNHFIPGMNCAVIRIHDGQMHRIYGNSFERFGQYNEVLTEDDKKNIGLIVWDSIVAIDQITGGLIENNRMVYKITLDKKYRIRADHINIREFAVEPADVCLHHAKRCYCEFTYDRIRENLGNEADKNTIVNHSGSISQFANMLSVTRRNDVCTTLDSKPGIKFDWGFDASGKQKDRAYIHQDEEDRITISTRNDTDLDYVRAAIFSQGCTILPQYYDTEGVSLNGALRYVDRKLLFRTNNEWKVVTLTDL